MAGGQIGAVDRRVETPMFHAYRLWLEHTLQCADGCKRVHKAQDGCEAGRELWGTYRLARIGKGRTTTP